MTNVERPEITVKDEYVNLIPKQSVDEYEGLKASIRDLGVLYPIVLNQQGIILDGHSRYRISQELGIPCPYVLVNLSNDSLLEKQFIIEANCTRRHLTKLQRIELALKMEPLYKERAKKRMMASEKRLSLVRTRLY